MTEHLFVRHQFGLMPDGDAAVEFLSQIGQGESVGVTLTKPRNPLFHKLGMALLRALYENQERYRAFTPFRKGLTVRLGYYTAAIDPKGNAVAIPDSLSFSGMDESEFHDFVRAAQTYALENPDGLFAMDEQSLSYIAGFVQ